MVSVPPKAPAATTQPSKAPKGAAKPRAKDRTTSKASRWHVVQKDQKLGSIAKRYHVDLTVLCTANRIARRNKIQPGMKLIIPAKEDRDGSAARALRDKVLGLEPPERPRKGKDSDVVEKEKSAPPTKGKAAAEQPASFRPFVSRPQKKGVISLEYRGEVWSGRLFGRSGRVLSKARRDIEALLSKGEGAELDPALLALVVRISDTFGGRTIHVVSGTRGGTTSEKSRHKEGRALDFTVEDMPVEALRDFCKSLEHVGVGYYPKSGFIHLDVRDRWTYWVDESGRGEPPRYTSTVVKASDAPNAPEVRVR